eukprot:m51a1_g4840 hypothetical protein (87) ;mRNA; f:221528-221788
MADTEFTLSLLSDIAEEIARLRETLRARPAVAAAAASDIEDHGARFVVALRAGAAQLQASRAASVHSLYVRLLSARAALRSVRCVV